MLDDEQWEFYGMFACLLDECEQDYHLYCEAMTIEAEGEGMDEHFEEGRVQMYQWLFQQNRSIRKAFPKNMIRPCIHFGGNPLTIH